MIRLEYEHETKLWTASSDRLNLSGVGRSKSKAVHNLVLHLQAYTAALRAYQATENQRLDGTQYVR